MEERKRHKFKFREEYDKKYGTGAVVQSSSLSKGESVETTVSIDDNLYRNGLYYFEETYKVICNNGITNDAYYGYLREEYRKFQSVEKRIIKEHPEYESVALYMQAY